MTNSTLQRLQLQLTALNKEYEDVTRQVDALEKRKEAIRIKRDAFSEFIKSEKLSNNASEDIIIKELPFKKTPRRIPYEEAFEVIKEHLKGREMKLEHIEPIIRRNVDSTLEYKQIHKIMDALIKDNRFPVVKVEGKRGFYTIPLQPTYAF